jgi:endonuclease/exonuclease/phosphatase family metal-dependent hydrolase
MAKSRKDSEQIEQALRLLQKLPPKVLAPLVLLLVVGGLIFAVSGCPNQPNPKPGIVTEPGTYLFCSWNVENFYDDEDNPKEHDEMENFFGTNQPMVNVKVKNLSDTILKMNNYVGPDIIALVEVESERAMTLLKDKLNETLEKVGKGNLKYENILFKEDRTGRGFAPAILTRLPVIRDKTRQLGSGAMKRILEGHIKANDHELIVIAAHWTSRVTDKDDDGKKRAIYADACYGRFREIFTANPDADIIVCGDFNDEFKDRSLQEHLYARNDEEVVKQAQEVPLLYDLCARFDGSGDPKGTIYGVGKWSVFDHICISRGLFDARGWTCDTKQTEIFAPDEMRFGKQKTPFKFGGPKQTGLRGFSDHFPVITQLRLQGGGDPQ